VNPQWNLAFSEANVLRGLHVHVEHSDWFCVASGAMFVGLLDLRVGRSRRRAVNLRMGNAEGIPEALLIPPGVAHGFYNSEPAVHVYGTSTAWSADDELGCRFDDPDVGIDWPLQPGVTPLLSERDRSAGSLRDLVARLTF
jgi:dTDP-4-dehydrorhamnose 3,5-epimerase